LEQEKAQGKAGRIALSLLRIDLVILDELTTSESTTEQTIKEDDDTDKTLHLSTADRNKFGFHPWLIIESARWLSFSSAPTYPTKHG
jgi:hypothetical protein